MSRCGFTTVIVMEEGAIKVFCNCDSRRGQRVGVPTVLKGMLHSRGQGGEVQVLVSESGKEEMAAGSGGTQHAWRLEVKVKGKWGQDDDSSLGLLEPSV